MSRKIRARPWLLAVPVGVVLVASIMVPLALAQGPPASVVRQTTQGNGCTLQTNRPLHPLELNMETLGPRFKTIAMEKEIFQCPSVGGGDVGAETVSDGQIVDVETFIEIIERATDDDGGDNGGDNGGDDNGGPVVVTDRRVEIVRCVKDFDAGRVDCRIRQEPLPRFNQNEPGEGPLTGCGFSKNNQPEDPVAMETAKTGGFVKTVKVEKEHLSCKGGPRDLYLFTEIIEAARRRGGAGSPVTIRPVQRRFDAVLCLKNSEAADIEQCVSFNPQFTQLNG